MAITSAIVLYAVIWFMTLFVSLPIGLRTQGDEDEIVPGTHAGSPANLNLKRKLVWVTVIGTAIWIVAAGIILSGVISVDDLDVLRKMRPDPGTGG